MSTATSETIKILKKSSVRSESGTAMTVVLESSNPDLPRAIEDLQTLRARTIAMSFADEHGISDPRIDGVIMAPYAVNKKGQVIHELQSSGKQLPADHADLQPASYRVDVPVVRRLV